MRVSFRYKTVIGVALIEALFLSLLIVNSLRILSSSHEQELEHRARTLSDVFSKAISDAVLSLDLATLNILVDDLMQSSEVQKVEVANDQQLLVSRSRENLSGDRYDIVRASSDITINTTRYGQVTIWLDASYVDEIVQRAQTQSIRIALVEIVFVGIASLFLGIYLTKQLSRLKYEIKSVESGDLTSTFDERFVPDDEIGDTLNAFFQLKTALVKSNADRESVLAQVSQLATENLDKETWLRAIINQLADGIIAFDEQGTIHYANEPARTMLGYESNPLIGLTVYDLPLTAVQHERITAFIESGSNNRSRETLTRHRNELIYRTDGTAVSSSVTLSYTRINETDYFILSLGEVSWRRQVERQMMTSDAIRTGILESSISAIVAIDHNDRVLEFNTSAEKMFGYRRQKVMGELMAELIMPERFREAHRMGMKHFLSSGEGPVLGQRIEIVAIDIHHREFPVTLAITPIQTNEGYIFTAVIEDISERIENTQRLTAAKEKADRANQEKSRFLASMSHEIRTPLNIMLGMVDLLQGTRLDNQQKNFVVSAENAGRNLLDMINDVLDLSKIEAGKMEPNTAYFNPVSVFEETVQLFVQRCWSNSLRLFVFVGQEIPEKIFTDASFYRQIISNLMANAINYTQSGYIEAKLYLHRINGLMHLCVDIKDTGSGLSKDEQNLLFQDYSQIHKETPKESRGTGLGLVICREMANILGGDIALKSEEGKGSTFSLQLPLAIESMGKRINTLRGTRCGLISNSSPWMVNMEHQLCSWGATVEVLGLKSPMMFHSVDVVLLDLATIDILEVKKHIGPRNELSQRCSVIQIIEQSATLLTEGYVYDSLSQPVSSSRLLASIKNASLPIEFREPSSVIPLETETHTEAIDPGGKVLLVDDSEGNRVIASAYLTSAGYLVVEAGDGIEAIEKIKEYKFDLILMDMRMPTMGGIECVEIIRREQLAENVPIVALTAHAILEARDECLAAGMQDFLTKPIERQKLLQTVSNWLNGRLIRDETTQENPKLDTDESVKETFLTFNMSIVEQLIEDTNQTATAHMLNVFFQECERRMVILSQAREENNPIDFEVSVHALKSSAKTFGCEFLSEVARQAEEACKENDFERAWELGDQLKTVVPITLKAMTKELSQWWSPGSMLGTQ
jgi:PAS domain S-box-containing protein